MSQVSRRDTHRARATRHVTDVVTHADADPRRFESFGRPDKPTDDDPAIDPGGRSPVQ